MRLWALSFAATCLVVSAAHASRRSDDRAGSAVAAISFKAATLESLDFSSSVKNLPEDYANRADCRCNSEIRAPEFQEFPSSAIHTINNKLRTYAKSHMIGNKTDYDSCQSSSLDYSISAANQSFVSVRFTQYMDCGAYPVSTSDSLSFDARTGEKIEWKTLVDEKKLSMIEKACQAQYEEILNDPQENESVAAAKEAADGSEIEVADEMFSLKGKALDNAFSIREGDKKLVLMLDEKFWPHAMGSIDCIVPAGAMKPAFSELFGTKGGLE